MSAPIVAVDILRDLIGAEDSNALTEFINSLTPSDTARALSRLSELEQRQLLCLIDPAEAADVIEDIHETQATDLIEDIPASQAAAIMEELSSDHLVDMLGEMELESRNAILSKMHQEDADEARKLMAYDPDCAGGLMISEYLAYSSEKTISYVLEDLQKNRQEYIDYHVQYFYVTDNNHKLVGVLRVHDLLFPAKDTLLSEIMIQSPLSVLDTSTIKELEAFFEEHNLLGAPVVDLNGALVGVVLPKSVEEAIEKKQTRTFLRLSGIVGGEEFRTMPLLSRSGRRLSWLSVNIVLNIFAASVIALYQDTLAAAITLAVFLPMVSDMSGCAGNQAVAVSMRELSLGLVRPKELFWVLAKEAKVGVINGLILGSLLGGIAYLWQGNPWLGIVIGGALSINTVVSVCLGGALPLMMKRFNLDPALVSGPLLTTVTDMCGFFFVLSFASAVLHKL